jgi:hypothetical protein
MKMSFEVDFSELRILGAELARVPAEVAPKVRKSIEVTARYVKDDWAKDANRKGLSSYSKSVDYEVTESSDSVEAEIGPNVGKKQGRFGFVEEANGGVGSAPQHAGRDASRKNEKDFVKGLEDAIGDFL